jgi:hypothetical protein
MSTTVDVQLVNLLSRWLAGHVGDDELRAELDVVDTDDLAPEQAGAIDELREELARADGRPELQRAVRETLEVLCFGD